MGKSSALRRVLALATAVLVLTIPAEAQATGSATGTQSALANQYELGSSVPLRNAPWVGTHNSYNSAAEMGLTLSSQDSNQKITIAEQLDQGIRSIELDLHWFPSVPSLGDGLFAPVVCHAAELHAGCTLEKSLGPILDEVSAWLRAPGRSDQVILIFLEDHLDNAQGYDTAAATIEERLGDLVHHPAGPGCTELPLNLTRDEVRAAGKQVILVSGCGFGGAWPGVAYSWEEHEETRPRGFEDFPSCGPDFTRQTYESTLVRYYEDSTKLTNTVGSPDDGITPETAAAMARCGVDLLGLDQLTPGDPRLDSLVWSWAPGEPAKGRCASQIVNKAMPYGRWRSLPCSEQRRVACSKSGRWIVPKARIVGRAASEICAERGAALDVPRTGFEAQRLRRAMERREARSVWIDFRRVKGEWRSTA